ncbi:MAG: acyltransferase family protein [Ilyomonas sp.]
MKRLYSLDYLRGLAAFSIMLYHYFSWTYGNFSVDGFWGRIGVYGVSIFYVLSGLTLQLVYSSKMEINKKSILEFFRKRFFRIFPLLWLATLTTVLLRREGYTFITLFLNFTGLFGLLKWDGYLATGAWSIGNELVFYLFFPLFIFTFKRSKTAFLFLSLIILGIYLYFAFFLLEPNTALSIQWKNYINPLNQVFLFFGGFIIGALLKEVYVRPSVNLIILAIAIFAFSFYPIEGNAIHIVTGWKRIFFTLCCFLICLCFYKLHYHLPKFIDKPLAILGEASYSVYLLHPIVFSLVQAFQKRVTNYFYDFPVVFWLIAAVISTLTLGYFVYDKFEKYFMQLSRRIAVRI